MSAIEPGDRVRVVRDAHRRNGDGVVIAVHDTWAEVQPDGCAFTTIDPDLADLELIAKGSGEPPEVGFAVFEGGGRS